METGGNGHQENGNVDLQRLLTLGEPEFDVELRRLRRHPPHNGAFDTFQRDSAEVMAGIAQEVHRGATWEEFHGVQHRLLRVEQALRAGARHTLVTPTQSLQGAST